jgi:DNA-binding transcriptional MerR regulator
MARARDAVFRYKMKDLSALTGLPRQAIHFYIQQGLVPEGRKTGRNMAYYSEAHVERIKLIRRLQHERFLPLKAIRAVIDEGEGAFSAPQRELLREVKLRLGGRLAPRAEPRETVEVKDVLARAKIDRRDFDDLVALGVFAVVRGPRGKLLVAKDDAWMIELWGEVRAAGFTRALGFGVETISIFETAVSEMVEKETELMTTRLAKLGPEGAAALVLRALPLIHTFVVRYHETKLRNLFAAF